MEAKVTIRSFFSELMAALLILLFLYTAIMKFRSLDRFEKSMIYNPALERFATFLSRFIPVTELIIVFLLILPNSRRIGLLAGALLMAAFTGYVAYMLVNIPSKDRPCSCGGIIEHLTWHQHFWFNLIMTLISLAAFFLYTNRFVATNRRSRTPANHSRQQLTNQKTML